MASSKWCQVWYTGEPPEVNPKTLTTNTNNLIPIFDYIYSVSLFCVWRYPPPKRNKEQNKNKNKPKNNSKKKYTPTRRKETQKQKQNKNQETLHTTVHKINVSKRSSDAYNNLIFFK